MGALQQALDQQIHSCHDIYLTGILMTMTHLLKMMAGCLTLIVRNSKNRLKSSFHMLQMHHDHVVLHPNTYQRCGTSQQKIQDELLKPQPKHPSTHRTQHYLTTMEQMTAC